MTRKIFTSVICLSLALPVTFALAEEIPPPVKKVQTEAQGQPQVEPQAHAQAPAPAATAPAQAQQPQSRPQAPERQQEIRPENRRPAPFRQSDLGDRVGNAGAAIGEGIGLGISAVGDLVQHFTNDRDREIHHLKSSAFQKYPSTRLFARDGYTLSVKNHMVLHGNDCLSYILTGFALNENGVMCQANDGSISED